MYEAYDACHDVEMGSVVAIINQKGGVGKTTVTLGLASAAAESGAKVLVVDLDPQAASTWALGVDPGTTQFSVIDVFDKAKIRKTIQPSTWSEQIDVLPSARGLQEHEHGSAKRLRSVLHKVTDDYDAVLIDCPPSLGNLSASGLAAADHAIIVVEPSALGLRGISAVVDLIDDVWDTTNPDLDFAGVIVNKVPAISNEAERRLDELRRLVGKKAVWKPSIPSRVIVNQSVGERRPIHSYGARSADVSAAFDQLWIKLAKAVRR